MKKTRLNIGLKYLFIIALLVAAVVGVRRCIKQDIKEAIEFREPEKVFEKIYLADSSMIALQKAEIVSLQEMNRRLRDENSRLKNAKVLVQTEVKTIEKNIFVEIHDTIKDTSTISVPKAFTVRRDALFISGRIVKAGLALDTVESTVGLNVSIGYKKPVKLADYFHAKQLYSEVKTTTPNTTISSVRTFVLDEKPKWYERRITAFALGAVTATSLIIFSP